MLSDVSFGSYYPVSSFVHKLDPRVKILLLVAYLVAVFAADNFLSLAVAVVFLCVAVAFSKVPVGSVLKSVKGILILLIFTAILNVCFYQPKEGDTVYFWVVSKEGIINAAFIAARLIALVLGSSVLTLTTTPVGLTDALESILKPLTWIKFPVHELALVTSIALRFIPTLASETDRIINAQKARGADFESGNIIKRVKALVPVLIPLLVSAFRRADELGDAMEARCYSGSKNRVKYKVLKLGWRDPVAISAAAIALTGVFLLNAYASTLLAVFL